MSLTTDTRWTPCSAVMDCRAVYDHDYRQVAVMERYIGMDAPGHYLVKMGDEISPSFKTVTACLEWVKERLA